MMNPLQSIKNSYNEILRPLGFRQNGKIWHLEINKQVLHFIAYELRTVASSQFNLGVSYGVSVVGVQELLYGHPLELKHAIELSLIRASLNPDRNKISFKFLPGTPVDDLNNYIKNRLEEEALPFLAKFETAESICVYLEMNLMQLRKTDSIAVLKLASLYALLGNKQRAIDLARMVISDSRKPYLFAGQFLNRIE